MSGAQGIIVVVIVVFTKSVQTRFANDWWLYIYDISIDMYMFYMTYSLSS